MTVTSRCNYAGPLGKLIPTRSLHSLFARLSWFSHDDKLSVTGFVNNLTDRRYQVHGRPNGTAGQYVITYGDPRTVGLSVTSRF